MPLKYCKSSEKVCPAGPPGLPGTTGAKGPRGRRGQKGKKGSLGPVGSHTKGSVTIKGRIRLEKTKHVIDVATQDILEEILNALRNKNLQDMWWR